VGIDRDEASTWIRWMKSTPTPLLIDLSADFQRIGNSSLTDEYLTLLGMTRKAFLERMGCRLILLPSGASLSDSLVEATGGMIYGKLLYGGVTRYRLLQSSTSSRTARRAGERTEVKSSLQDNIPSWIQYGGSERLYEVRCDILWIPDRRRHVAYIDIASLEIMIHNLFDFLLFECFNSNLFMYTHIWICRRLTWELLLF
jgi:hypothetical protein